MNKQERIDDFERFFNSLNDPEERERRRRATERLKRKEERMQDTGAYVV